MAYRDSKNEFVVYPILLNISIPDGVFSMKRKQLIDALEKAGGNQSRAVEIFQAVRLNKYLDFQGDVFIHRKGAKNAKV